MSGREIRLEGITGNDQTPRVVALLREFCRLYELDAEFRRLALDVMAWWSNPNLPEDGVILTGSTAEGCLLARWFREGKSIVEIDLLFVGAVLNQNHLSKNIENIPQKPGFVRIRYDSSVLVAFVPKLQSDVREIQNSVQSPYLCGRLVKKDMTLRRMRYQDEKGVLKLMVSLFFGVYMSDIQIEDNSDVEGPSANVYVNIKTPTGHILEYSSDNVAALKCDFWPPMGSEWISRKRQWPSHDVIRDIVAQGCHLVSKCTVGGDDDTEWRWSFSLAEKTLALKRSPQQCFCYLIFKSIFYARLKFEIEEKTLPSYLVKTLMLWMCEKIPPEAWSEEQLVTRLRDLIAELGECLRVGHLRHYFLPQINLMADLPAALITEALAVVEDVQADPLAYLPADVTQMCALADYIIKVLRNILSAAGSLSWQLVNFLVCIARMRGSLDIELD